MEFEQNEQGDYILNVLDFGGYLVVGGEIDVDVNVTKLLEKLEEGAQTLEEIWMSKSLPCQFEIR